jgi:predicted O-linked N-acetylglucosamine transferase (SPINDLY family)
MKLAPTLETRPIVSNIIANLEKGNLKAAELMSELLLDFYPEDKGVNFLTAKVKLSQPKSLERGIELARIGVELSENHDGIMQLLHHFIKINPATALTLSKIAYAKFNMVYDVVNLFGVILRDNKLLEESIKICQEAISLTPTLDRAWLNLGISALLLSENELSAEAFTKAVELNRTPFSMHLKGAAYIKLAEYKTAQKILHETLELSPNDPNVIVDLCNTYYSLHDYEPAMVIINEALRKTPTNLDFLKTKAAILRQMGKVYDTIQILGEVLKIDPKDIKALIFMGNAYYHGLGDGKTARKYYDAAYTLKPEDPEAVEKLCTFLQETREGSIGGNVTMAHWLACKLISLVPAPKAIAGAIQPSILTALDYDTHDKLGDRKELLGTFIGGFQMGRVQTMDDRLVFLEAHRKWGESAEAAAKNNPIVHKAKKKINKKIKIGILSSDLRHHPVGYFAWPIAEHLDRHKFELHCYSAFPYEPDATQKAFMEKSNSFRLFREEGLREIAQSIADDGLDILFELGGKTLYNRLGACPYKPAPVQVSWLGYPNSIGLPSTIDYILVDPYIKPEDPRLLLEKPFMVPNTWVSLDKVGFAPTEIVSTIPQDTNGYITFGTLNAAHKFTPETFATWATIMHMVPNSRFLYVRLEADAQILRDNFCKHMAKHGIDKDRISFIATNEHHLQFYNKIDIALDTFPHTGGTTTCETLWMGVPVVTLVGPAMFERLSYSNITNAGLGDLCAFTVEEYKQLVLKLVDDPERRRYLRKNLRAELANQPLGQPKEFVKGFCNTILQVLNR